MSSDFTFEVDGKQFFEIPIVVRNNHGNNEFKVENIHNDMVLMTELERKKALKKAFDYVRPRECSVGTVVGVLVKDENNVYKGLQFGTESRSL